MSAKGPLQPVSDQPADKKPTPAPSQPQPESKAQGDKWFRTFQIVLIYLFIKFIYCPFHSEK